MASRALVLSGGGPVGIAWESGLIGGLAKAGVDVSRADFILGTSAGAFVGSRLALGISPEALAAPYLAMDDTPAPPSAGKPAGEAEPRAPNLSVLTQKLEEAQGAGKSAGGVRAALGAYALEAKTISEETFIKSFGRSFSELANDAWPDRGFACTAVDTADGAFRLWTAEDGVGVARAVASSCSVPGVYPPVTIGGRRYMDGGVRSGTNADKAVGHERVLIVAIRAGAEGPLAERAKRSLDGEVRTLIEAGAKVEVVYPDQGSLDAFGSNMMDARRRPAAAKAGYAQGLAGADALKGFWD